VNAVGCSWKESYFNQSVIKNQGLGEEWVQDARMRGWLWNVKGIWETMFSAMPWKSSLKWSKVMEWKEKGSKIKQLIKKEVWYRREG
jgi:hypothetical protein